MTLAPLLALIAPLALGVAASPLPVIAVIVMLLSVRARTASAGFLAGWVIGIVTAVSVFALLSSTLADADPAVMSAVQGITQLTLGLVLVLFALVQFARRPKPGTVARIPTWLSTIDALSALRAGILAFALAAVNPKNLILSASAGIAIGGSGVTLAAEVTAVAVFTVVAASTVVIPVIAYRCAGDRLAHPLDRLRAWLVRHNAVVVTVLLLAIGGSMILSGILALR